MRKYFLYAFILFFSISLFASEIPEQLNNWIIPQNFKFGTSEKISEMKECYFSQPTDNKKMTFLSVRKKSLSNIDLPSWFTQRKLITWDSTYDEALNNLSSTESFLTEQGIESWIEKDNNNKEYLLYSKKIILIPLTNPDYSIILYFYKNEDYTLSEFYIRFYETRTKLPTPKKQIFAQYRQNDWNTFSEIEKNAIALSSPLIINQNYLSTYFDLSNQPEKTVEDTKTFLANNWYIYNKEDLLEQIDFLNHSSNEIYNKNLKLFSKYTDINLLEIAEKEKMNLIDTTRLIYAYEMKEKLGKHGTQAWDAARKIMIIRMSLYCNYISKEEAIELVEPIVNECIENYTNLEDFYSHYIAGTSFRGIEDNGRYLLRASNIINCLDYTKEEISPDIIFNGKNADLNHIMTLDECWFDPSTKYQKLFDLEKEDSKGITSENIQIVDEIINQYGNYTFLTEIKNNPGFVRYDSFIHGDQKNFFEKYYRTIWNSLPEIEKCAVSFSSNLLCNNNDYLLDFSCKSNFKNEDYHSISILNDWEITNHDQLIKAFINLKENGQAKIYSELYDLIEKHPDLTPLEIGRVEGLSIYNVGRIEFVASKKDILGKHGIEAWDEGRQINIVRWAIGAGYISADEAKTLLEPLIKNILSNYSNWEDYMSHYIAGRCFSGIASNIVEQYYLSSCNAVKNTYAYIPTEEITFSGENADLNHKMKLDMAQYIPSESAKKWEKAINIYYQKVSFEEILELEKEFPQMPCLIYEHSAILSNEKYEEDIEYLDENMDILNSLSPTNTFYMNCHYHYLCCLNNTYQPAKTLEHFDSLDRKLQENLYVFFQHAYANYLLANSSTEIEERIIYQSRAAHDLKILKRSKFNIGKYLEDWLNKIDDDILF